MRRILIVGLAAAATMTFATATAGDMTGLFGNTIECRYPDGKITKVWVEAGGKYSIQRPDGSRAEGRWVDGGSEVCYNDTNPAPPPNAKAVCSPSNLRKVGDSWDVTDPFGGKCTAHLVAGKS
jgi:hypothetical protein